MKRAQMQQFEDRLAQIDKIHAAGGAFEASGALGRAYFDSVRKKPRSRLPIHALALLFLGAILFKGAVFAQLGDVMYDSRVNELAAGNLAQQALSWVLHADTATRMIGGLIHSILY